MSNNKSITTSIKTTIKINSNLLSNDYKNLILSQIKNDFEGKNGEYNYIEKNSIRDLNIKDIEYDNINFGGIYNVFVEFICDIIVPQIGGIIECTIHRLNDMSIFAISGPFQVILLFEDNENYNITDFTIGQKIKVEILEINKEFNNEYIQIYARMYDKNNESILIEDESETKSEIIEENDEEQDEEIDDIKIDEEIDEESDEEDN